MTEKQALSVPEQLIRILSPHYPELTHTTPILVGEGLDFRVFRATVSGQEVAIKVPKNRYISNKNDNFQDTLDLIKQEKEIICHLRGKGIPLPEFIFLYEDHDNEFLPFLIYGFIETDRSQPDFHEMGSILRRLHSLPADWINPVAQEGEKWTTLLAKRIASRLSAIKEMADIPAALYSEKELEDMLELNAGNTDTSLVHLDLRIENILAYKTQVKAIIDWSNAIIAPPLVEFTRLYEYGILNEELIRGYGNIDFYTNANLIVRTICHLDTAVMLGIVFLSEAPDVERAELCLRRIDYLLNELNLLQKP